MVGREWVYMASRLQGLVSITWRNEYGSLLRQ